MNNNFYRAFEECHRGSVELITSRLQVYLPFITPMKTLTERVTVLDLGCGRGEWLGLMQEQGFHAIGVDLDAGMLSACKQRGFTVTHTDAVNYIKNCADESVHIVSAFHFVEHIPFDTLKEVVAQIYRVLKPGGLLIFETPNSENLLVGTSSFYLDPTHERPVPAQLLEFLMDYTHFYRRKTLLLQEPAHIKTAERLSLWDVFASVSPDYGIVAQKNADSGALALFDKPFQQDYGASLENLVKRYEYQLMLERDGGEGGKKLQGNSIAELSKHMLVSEQLQERVKKLEDHLIHCLGQLQGVYASKSWRLTLPLRQLTYFMRHVKIFFSKIKLGYIARALRAFLKRRILGLAHKLQNNTRLKIFIFKRLARYPKLRAYLRQLKAHLDARAQSNSYRMNTAAKNNTDYSPNALRIQAEFSALLYEEEKNHAHSD